MYSEKISATKERPELERMIKMLRKGDVVIVWKLDRLGRSLKHLIYIRNPRPLGVVMFILLCINIFLPEVGRQK